MVLQQTRPRPQQHEIAGQSGSSEDGRGPYPVPLSPDSGPNTLCIDLLGSPEFHLSGQTLIVRTRKSLGLLVYLAVERYQHPREHLVDLFWPDAELDDGRASLRTALSGVRQLLGAEADTILTANRDFVSLPASAPLYLDVQALTDAQRLIRRAQSAGTPCPESVRRQIENAAERYRGPFLSGISVPDAPDFEAWMERQRTYWRGVEAELLDRLATLQVEAGDMGAAVTTLEGWTTVDPDEEAPWRRLIELYLGRSDMAGARRAWRAYRDSLAELEAEPSAEMSELATHIREPESGDPAPEAGSSDVAGDLDLRHVPFVGRSHEHSLMLAAHERSQTGRTEVVIVEGIAGIGKTRLVSHVLQSAERAGADILAGRALETASELPYAALVDALRARLERENAPDDLLGDLWLAELARLVPELRERYPDLPEPMDDSVLQRGKLFEAVARFGQALAARSPLVLFLDDMQWADLATRDLVRYAVRRWSQSGTPVLLILTVRSNSLGTERELAQWFIGLERETSALRLEVGALQHQDVLQLIDRLSGYPSRFEGPDFPENGGVRHGVRFGEWLADRAGGHPALLIEALRMLLDEGVLRMRPTVNDRWVIEFPDAIEAEHDERLGAFLRSCVRVLIAERLNQLGDVEAQVLAAAAFLPGEFTDERVMQVASVDEDAALRALDTLVRGRLLRETEENEGYDFTHRLIREAVYDEVGRARQRVYQRRALAATRESPAFHG